MALKWLGVGKPETSAARSDPEGFIQSFTQSSDWVLLLGPQKRQPRAWYGLQLLPGPWLGKRACGFQGRRPPWLAIWFVLITCVWEAHGDRT